MTKLKSLPLLGGAATALIIATVFARAQVPTQSYLRNNPDQIEREDPRVQQIIARAEEQFRLGELNLRDNKREEARRKFDLAVETVLKSGMDVRSNPRLQKFYLELVERVYRVEVPTPGVPTSTGGAPFVEVAKGNYSRPLPPQVGFVDQKFESSPPDELSKIVLSPEYKSDSEPASANRRCAAVSADKIELRGFQLGMTLSDVKARIPDLRVGRPDSFGEARSFTHVKSNGYLSRNTTLKGVVSVGINFFDGRVSSLYLVYDDSIKWKSSDEFVTHVATALALPADWPVFDSGDHSARLRVLNCEGFSFVAGLARIMVREHPVAFLRDLGAFEKRRERALDAAERKRRAEEQRKKAFKP